MRDDPTAPLVITGGGRGIGAAVARRAARDGWTVCVAWRNDEVAARAVVRAIEAEGGRAMMARADVAVESDVIALFDACARAFGPPGGLVTCAGVAGGRTPFVDLRADDFDRVIAVNLRGTLLCCREAARRMAASRGGAGGAIVTVSSTVARFGGRRLAAYTASKGGVEALTLALARELADEGIRVNAVSPGIIDTDQQTFATEAARRAAVDSVPLGRLGDAGDVAEAVAWLLSPAASYVTGAILPVAGGR